MAYNRLPYQAYDEMDPNQQSYPTGYPPELPYQEEYAQPPPVPYDAYNYPMNSYQGQSYGPPRRGGWDGYPRDYQGSRQAPLDYQEGAKL